MACTTPYRFLPITVEHRIALHSIQHTKEVLCNSNYSIMLYVNKDKRNVII